MGKQSKILAVLCGLIVILLVGSYALIQMTDKAKANQTETVEPEQEKQSEPEKEPEPEKEVVPESKTGLMIGFDQSNKLTDVLMVGRVDTEQNKIKVISVPRDFYIDFSQEPFKSIKKANPNIQIAHCRINEIYINMGAKEEGLQVLKQVIEALTGLTIDYMATINVSGFKEVVDIVGGVEFDVPERMYKMDPYQNPPLRIDLQPGLQLLNGEQAQGLVRFRGYKMGDFQRIKVQQSFITALFHKITASSTEQMTSLVKQVFTMFKADFGIVVIMDYLNYFLDKDIAHVMDTDNMITLEGYNDNVNGAAILRFDVEKNREKVKQLLTGEAAETEKDAEKAADEPKTNELKKADGQKDSADRNKTEEKQQEKK